MQILVDENIPLSAVKSLEVLGHQIIDVKGTQKEGINDTKLWQIAQINSALLVTTDKGFAQLRDNAHFGILIICLKQPNRKKIHERILNAIESFSQEDWPNTLMVVRDEVKKYMEKSIE